MSDTPLKPQDTVMLTVTLDASKATVAAAAAQLGLPLKAIDSGFGVVSIDPDAGLYAVKVARNAAPTSTGRKDFRGPFSNPRISTFNLTKKDLTGR